jgi:hypothetical protein
VQGICLLVLKKMKGKDGRGKAQERPGETGEKQTLEKSERA